MPELLHSDHLVPSLSQSHPNESFINHLGILNPTKQIKKINHYNILRSTKRQECIKKSVHFNRINKMLVTGKEWQVHKGKTYSAEHKEK